MYEISKGYEWRSLQNLSRNFRGFFFFWETLYLTIFFLLLCFLLTHYYDEYCEYFAANLWNLSWVNPFSIKIVLVDNPGRYVYHGIVRQCHKLGIKNRFLADMGIILQLSCVAAKNLTFRHAIVQSLEDTIDQHLAVLITRQLNLI